MGIRGGTKNYLMTTVLGVPNSGISRVPLSKYRGKRVVIDWSNMAHRFLNRVETVLQLVNEFINLIHKFARERITIIFVFDGKPRDEKMVAIEHRKNVKSKAFDKISDIIANVSNPDEDLKTIMHLARRVKTIKPSHMDECKKLFDVFGIHYIHLEHIEADCIFKFLLDNDFADVCFSGDMDLLAYGCKYIIQDLDFKEDTIVEIDYNMLLTHLRVSQQQLLMAFILSGTDWNNGLKKTNFSKNLEFIKKYGDIPSIIAVLDELNRDLPEDRHVGLPVRFDWEFSVSVYTEVIAPDIVDVVITQFQHQSKQTETMQQHGFNVLLEYGKIVLENDADLKYTKKYQQYVFWKYAFHLELIPHTNISSGCKTRARYNSNSQQTQKKLKN